MDANGRPSTIYLKTQEGRRYEEGRAAEALIPGMIAALNGDNALIKQATSAGFAERAIVTEHCAVMAGGGTIDTEYAIGDLVSYYLALPGDEVFVFLADGENVNEGDALIPNGAGYLIKTTGTPKQIWAYAREAMDLSGVENTTAKRIKARVA